MVAFPRRMAKLRKNACVARVFLFHAQLPACGHIQTRNLKITMPLYRKSRTNSKDLLPWHKRLVLPSEQQ